jgi:two-component system chemotaxis response regulator CheB
MNWHQIVKGWKRLISKVASPQSAAQEYDSGADHSTRAAPSGGDGYDEARVIPYIPDMQSERNDSSLHLSC